MNLMHVVTPDGQKLFSGTKHACKQFVRKNRVKRYQIRSTFSEKVVVAPTTTTDYDSKNYTDTESYFNKMFYESE
jgi:hypothetical protein